MREIFYINLGVILVTIYVDRKYYSLAYHQVENSRYGQCLSQHLIVCDDCNYNFIWELNYEDSGWSVRVNGNDEYKISDLSLLGVHFDNQNDEVSDCFEQALFNDLAGYHASLVSDCSGRVIMICGKSGTGKTSLTKAYIEQGYYYVSDDIALIDAELKCYYFQTSFHSRVDKLNSSHKINDEYRAFERINSNHTKVQKLKLGCVLILNSITEGEISIAPVDNIYKKFQLVNSCIIGFPNCDYIFALSKAMLTLPFYNITLSKNNTATNAVMKVGELLCPKSM